MREHTDGDFPFANDFNAVIQALEDSAAIVSGCEVTDGGSTTMTVDVASGKARINASDVDVGTQSVALQDADPDNDRYDVVVVDDTGTVDDVTGTASTTPKAPAIPADTALLAVVSVPAGGSGVSNDEIKDARGMYAAHALLEDHESDPNAHHTRDHGSRHHSGNADALDAGNLSGMSGTNGQVLTSDGARAHWSTPIAEPLYGDGSSGVITDDTNVTRGGIIRCTNYTLESGGTLTADDSQGFVAILAQESIEIHGTVDALGKGAPGGAGGTGTKNSGENGTRGYVHPLGSGGAGGGPTNTRTGGNGGGGGDGDLNSVLHADQAYAGITPILDAIESSGFVGAGGGGGGSGNEDNGAGDRDGENGNPPGGGGEGAGTNGENNPGAGGDGGDGGGGVLFVAPNITVSGTILVDGQDGQNGQGADAGGGGGGGGSGGIIMLCAKMLTENDPTYSVDAGAGGAGGTGNSSFGSNNAGDGAAGEAGRVIKNAQ